MNRRLMIAIFLLGLILGMVSSEALGEGPEDKDIVALYSNILIGELLPSGNVYLERFSLHGGYDNQQHFEGFNYSEQIEIYPIKKAKWARVRASFNRLIKATYIGEIEQNSRYFKYPFSRARQDALLYRVDKKTTDAPTTVVSINDYQIEKMIYFIGSDIREYSDMEFKTAMKRIRDDHARKDKYGSTLSKIAESDTILNARKLTLFHLKDVDYDILLSVYMTHGIEYASTVYVVDIIEDGKVVFTKEKYNTDGPY